MTEQEIAFKSARNPPPMLLGAGLLFWGWQTDFLLASGIMALLLEGSRYASTRWEFSYDDFRRLWSFSAVLFLAALVYAFTANEGPSGFQTLFQDPSFSNQRNAGVASAKTVTAWLRWLPMVFFPFMAAQAFSTREAVPLAAMSFLMRRRMRRLRARAQAAGVNPITPKEKDVNVSYPYLGLCLFSASIHSSENQTFFCGFCVLLAWALWSHRSKRFGLMVWAAALAIAIASAYFAQGSLGRFQRYLEGINPQWLADLTRRGFDHDKTTTKIGMIGMIKSSGKIVIRLEPKPGSNPPSLLREAAYRSYKGMTWNSDVGEKDFENILSETNATSWQLVPGKTNNSSVRIATYLPGGRGLLPLPKGSGRLEHLPAYTLRQSSLGAVLAEGPGLIIFDALYGPGPTLEAPFTTNDLVVLPKETNALDQIVCDLDLEGQTAQEAMRTLNKFFQTEFTYSTWQPMHRQRDPNETAIGRFLLRHRSGHCEYFATATTLLLRRAGIPARYAVGYAVHEASGKNFVVRQRDAHAWCLVWDAEKNVWEDFDTTPGTWLQAEALRASPFQGLTDAWSRIAFEFSRIRWAQTRLRQYLLLSLVPILAFLFYQIVFRSRRQRHLDKQNSTKASIWPGIDSEFYQFENKLRQNGIVREPGEPLSKWVIRASKVPAIAPLEAPINDLLQLHYRYRFDPQGVSEKERELLRKQADECLRRLDERSTVVPT